MGVAARPHCCRLRVSDMDAAECWRENRALCWKPMSTFTRRSERIRPPRITAGISSLTEVQQNALGSPILSDHWKFYGVTGNESSKAISPASDETVTGMRHVALARRHKAFLPMPQYP